MRDIILMKPGDGSEALALELIKHGFNQQKIHCWPAFSFELPTDTTSVVQRLQAKAAEGATIVVVSPTAVKCLKKMNICWPQHTQFAAVGASTAREIQTAFSPSVNVIYPEGTVLESGSEALFKLFQEIGIPKKVVIARGQTGREFLREELQKSGSEVQIEEVYRRVPIVVTAEQKRAVHLSDGVIVYLTSSDSVDVLLDNAGIIFAKAALYVTIHPRIKKKLEEKGLPNVKLKNSKDPDFADFLISLAKN